MTTNEKLNLMSQKTYDKLIKQRETVNSQYAETVKSRGESAAGGDWHDNAALDYFDAQTNLLSSQLANLNTLISTASIIHPPSSTRSVGIGTEVVVEFGQNDREKYLILGPADNDPSAGIISYETPLARSIMNKTPGETASFTVGEAGESRETKIKVITIKPGRF